RSSLVHRVGRGQRQSICGNAASPGGPALGPPVPSWPDACGCACLRPACNLLWAVLPMGSVAARSFASLLVVVTSLAGGCSAADNDDSGGNADSVDAGADEEGYGEYDGPDGTGAGEDDGDGPDDDIPNDEDLTDTEPGPYDALDEEGGSLDIDDESGIPDGP